MLVALMVLIIVGLVLWFWFASSKVHDIAVIAAKNICKKEHWQFLDETVALKKIMFSRGERGGLQFKRSYQFEYTAHSGERHVKLLTMCGNKPIYKTSSEDNVINFPTTKR